MKQGLKNSFNKNYLWVTIAGTNSVAHDSDINLFVYFPYNLLFMAGKDLLFCHKKMLLVFWVISHSVISIKMISINFTAKPDWLTDWLAKPLHGNHQGSNTDIWLKWNLRGRIFRWLLMKTFQPIRAVDIFHIEILRRYYVDNYHQTSCGNLGWINDLDKWYRVEFRGLVTFHSK